MFFTCEVTINKGRDALIKQWMDVDSFRFWQEGFQSFEMISGEYGREGAIANIWFRLKGKDMVLTETILVSDLPYEYGGRYDFNKMSNTMYSYFEELGPHQTKWTADIDFSETRGVLRWSVKLFPHVFRQQVQRRLEEFKEYAERYD